uniref:protein-tyrosine-phosphatase n=1 Tax=Meloidogyne floridensis TaxID=298350 RepID=A0A915P7F6_9BILA
MLREDIKFREIAQPPIEPILVNDKLVGSSRNEQIINKNIVPFTNISSSPSNSSSPSTLSGSFSFGNLACLPSVSTSTDFYVPSIASSCSIGALDQIRSTEITKLFDYLFLGSQKDALDNELLLRHGITRVINLSENCPRPTSLPDDLQHFLQNAKQEGEKVLIHCLAGISRSPTVAIAYVMRSRKMTNDEAYNFVKCRRPTISPNFNFLGQLFEYERILRQQNILPFNSSSISSSPPKLSPFISPSSQNEELNEIKKKLKENLKNQNLQHKPSLPLNSSLPPTTMARPKHLLTSKEDLKNFRHSCPSTTSISFLFKSPLPNSPIPSPSNEFSKLDISLSNPCFGLQKKEEQQKIPPPPQPPLSSSSCDNKLKTKIISSIENPVFDIPIKIKTLSKIKEATINSKEEKKKTKKERKQINSHEPSFISFLEKEENLEFSGNYYLIIKMRENILWEPLLTGLL